MTDLAVTLRVKARSKSGPIVYARWRDELGGSVERKVGPGWVVPIGSPEAKSKGRMIGETWTERAGRAPEGFLTPDRALQLVPDVVAAWRSEQSAAEDEEAADTETALDERAARLAAGALLRDVAHEWLEYEKGDDTVGWKKGTYDGHRFRTGRIVRELDDFLGHATRIEEVEQNHLRHVLRVLRPEKNGKVIEGQQMKLKTREQYQAGLRALFRWAVDESYILESPAEGDLLADGNPNRLRRRRRRVTQADVDAELLRDDEILTPAQIWAVVDDLRGKFLELPEAAQRSILRSRDLSVQDAAMVLLGGFNGLRAGEIIALEWRALDLEDGWLTVRINRTAGVTDTPKGARPRILRLEPEVLTMLRALRVRGYALAPTERVFIGRAGGHVDLCNFRKRFKAAQDRVGITPLRKVQGLRHSFAVAKARQGTPLAIIQTELGHSSPTLTARYRRFVRGIYNPAARISDRAPQPSSAPKQLPVAA
jgi:integrase